MTKILLVEDDKNLREIYGTRLYAEGYDIVSAGDGEQALAMAIKERPSLIISDVMMPKISGFDMLDILHSTTETKGIKVIMMTALSSEDQRARGEALGADRYLVKSQVGIEDVVRTVHEVLADAPGMAPSAPAAAPAPTAQQTLPPAPQPATASEPTPASVSPSPAPPAPAPQPSPAPVQMPQPTAPFSTARPATLGERVIHPIERPEAAASADLSAQLAQELSAASTTPQPSSSSVPIETPVTAPTPQPQAADTNTPVPAPAPMPTTPSQSQVPAPDSIPQPQTTNTDTSIEVPPLPHVPGQPQPPTTPTQQ